MHFRLKLVIIHAPYMVASKAIRAKWLELKKCYTNASPKLVVLVHMIYRHCRRRKHWWICRRILARAAIRAMKVLSYVIPFPGRHCSIWSQHWMLLSNRITIFRMQRYDNYFSSFFSFLNCWFARLAICTKSHLKLTKVNLILSFIETE